MSMTHSSGDCRENIALVENIALAFVTRIEIIEYTYYPHGLASLLTRHEKTKVVPLTPFVLSIH